MEKIICELELTKKPTQTGKTCCTMALYVNGVKLNLGIVDVYKELALLRAGIDIKNEV